MEMRDLSSDATLRNEEQPTQQPAPEVKDEAKAEVSTEETALEANPATTAPDKADNEYVDPEEVVEEEVTQAEEEAFEPQKPATKETLVDEAKAMLALDGADIQREAITRMRQHFATLRKIEIESARDQWTAEGNAPEAFVLAEDAAEAEFNDIVNRIREKKNAWAAEQEQQRQTNLAAKTDIIAQINALAEDTDNVNRTFPLYRELQDRFNAIGAVPPTEETAIWKKFQEARERYSDNLKINKELRDYDFKKNLDTKILLIQQAEALDNEEDVIMAFHRLQDLHDKWRQIGPVAKDLREEIWAKFKDASAVVNKKYQAYFEERKAREQQNEQAKTALCEKIEDLDFSNLANFAAWDDMTNQIIALQNQWKTIGFASRKSNNALFARFRERCDEFFTAKAAYFKSVKEEYANNLAKKVALAERAEALKDSTDWRKATDEFVAMQKEWKTIGPVPKRHSDAVWKRFLAACDYFFDMKKQATSGQRAQEQANLKIKKEIIEALKQITPDTPQDEATERLRELREKWQATGHVPFKDKDKINDAYRTLNNEIYKRFNMAADRARMDRFEANLSNLEGDKQKLYKERDRLFRALESRKIEIRTYENNLGFLSSKSKSGESMVNEFRRKIERLKEDINSLQDKIRMIDDKITD